ncbi:basement membrane-specific heparan sulfate proteoglycan core protein-like [Paramacrobiotus metropolitanus]|uniref:basement membrane-specific heparan sulfate proteoglycan core protein-like n=1 Tax=Paramacrobiotus metropolitanus TaxID=2943436 RepID=UPI002445C2A8|nr:basement membrane-specific heparan sulfate proteoglycan core protein-like [Paramacrobiotus metropolitanus]
MLGEAEKSVAVARGNSIELSCNGARPGQSVEWIREDGENIPRYIQLRNGNMLITSVDVRSAGRYICRIRGHPSSSARSSVHVIAHLDGGTIHSYPGQDDNFVSLKRGSELRIQCFPAGNNERTEWSRENGGPLPPNVRVEGDNLVIRGSNLGNGGRYICKSKNLQALVEIIPNIASGDSEYGEGGSEQGGEGEGGRDGGQGSGSVTIRTSEGDKTIAIPRNGQATLTCQVDGAGEVEWVREDGQPLPSQARLEGNVLTIPNVDVRSGGRYICRGRGSSQSSVVEVVVYPPSVPGYSKFIGVQVVPHRTVIGEDEQLTLECITTRPNAIVEWTRAEFEIPEEATIEDHRLLLNPTKETSGGFYICRAIGSPRGSQNFGQVSIRKKRASEDDTVQVDTDKPQIWTVRVPSQVSEAYFTEERKPTRLKCISPDGAQVYWERTDGPMPESAQINNGELFITSPVVRDTGRYVCRSRQNPDTVTFIQFTVIGELQETEPTEPSTLTNVEVTPDRTSAEEGSTVVFECRAVTPDGRNSRVIWEKIDGQLPAGVDPYSEQLVLNSIRQEDAGRYMCTAVDMPEPNRAIGELIIESGGNGEDPVPPTRPGTDIDVVGPPEIQIYIYPGEEVRINTGETLVIDCLVSDPSLRTQWIPPQRGSRAPDTSSPGRLILEGVGRADAGQYICRVDPGPGLPPVQKVVTVIIEGEEPTRPPEPTWPPVPTWWEPEPEPTTPAYPPTPVWPVYPPTRPPTRQPVWPVYPPTPYPEITTTPYRPIGPFRCRPDQATCMNGQCISRSGLCNGIQDCDDNSDEKNCAGRCEPTEFRCNNGKCVQKIWLCDGENDCGDGSDEQSCATAPPGSPCGSHQFLCERGDQCYPKNFQCDGTNDCQDGSDEIGCTGPTITVPPGPGREVNAGETVVLTCTAVGFPVPLISWRLNWGNIPDPPRVTVTSENGVGTLTIRDFQASDQGAYSCEAINNQNATIAPQDSILTLQGTVSDICQPPLFNAAARTADECLTCFCSGITQNCRSCSLYISEIVSRDGLGLVGEDGRPLSVNVRHDPASQEHTIETVNEVLQYGTPLWSLPTEFLGDQVTSYGSSLKYSVKHGPGGQPTTSPDVILAGNQVVLYHKSPVESRPDEYIEFDVPFRENAWSKSPGGAIDYVSRDDLMKVLQNVEHIRVKAVYDTLSTYSSIRGVKMGTATSQDSGLGFATQVEQCICPPGYDGLSCEKCAQGYERDDRDGRVQCRPSYPVYPPEPWPEPTTPEGQDCDPDGSVYPYRDDRTGQCTCKENTVGARCDQCRSGSFNLNRVSASGCDICFCSGVTKDCRSSGYYRNQVSVQPHDAINNGLKLTNRERTESFDNQVEFSPSENLIVLRGPGKNGQLFWQLPNSLVGERVSSYGGNLVINLRAENGNGPVQVLLFGNQIALEYSSNQEATPGQLAAIRVPLVERVWRRSDGGEATREHFLMALANLQYVLVSASGSLGEMSIDTAVPENTGQERADSVELCICPPGYKGLSCESCERGFTRTGSGLYLGLCGRCECNGHAHECDPESGQCLNCRDGTTGKECELCAPGYEGDPRGGRPCRPTGYPPEPEPRDIIQITPSVTNPHLDDYFTLRCDVRSGEGKHILWTFNGRQVDPSRARIEADGALLVIERFRPEDAGQYDCTVHLDSGYTGTSSVDIRRPVGEIPTGQPPTSPFVHILPPKSQTVRIGDTVQFRCIVRSPITYTSAWTKVGGRLPSRDSDVAGVLTIVNVQAHDVGTYVCTGSNAYQTASDRAELRIEGVTFPIEVDPTAGGEEVTPAPPGPWPPGPVELRIEPYFQRVEEGQPVEFRCIATGPQVQLSWHGGRDGRLNPQSTVSNGILRIPSAQVADEAEYFCNGTGPEGPVSARTILFVTPAQGLPEARVDQQEVRVRPGDPLRLRCWSDGDPQPEVTWSRADGALPANAIQQHGTLSVDSFSEPDQGVYICTATNAQGSRQTEVRVISESGTTYPIYPDPPTGEPPIGEFPAEVRVDNQRVTGAEGETVQLECTVTGNPAPVVTWTRGDRQPGETDNRVQIQNGKYIIQGARADDSGFYICEAANALGSSQGTITLEVEEKELPRVSIYPETPLRVQLGNSMYLQCRTDGGRPYPEVTWTRADGSPLPEGASSAERPDVLQFASITRDHHGAYLCTARNKFGSTTATGELQVEGMTLPPRVIITPSGPIHHRVGEVVRVECAGDGPDDAVYWHRDSAAGRVVAGPGQGRQELVIENASADDAGQYVCVVRDPTGTTSSFAVEVRIDPTGWIPIQDTTTTTSAPVIVPVIPVRPTDVSVTETPTPTIPVSLPDYRIEPFYQRVPIGLDSNATFECIHPREGQLAIYYTWTREDNQPLPAFARPQGRFLIFDSISDASAGKYICTLQTVNELKNMECELEVCDPDVEHCEPIKEQGEVRPRPVIPVIPVIPTAPVPSVAPVLVPTPEVERITPPPIGPTIDKNSIMRGERAEFKCEGIEIHSPETVKWNKREGQLPANSRIEGTSLIIENVQEEDAGHYICKINGQTSETILYVSGVVPRFRGRRDSYAVMPTALNRVSQKPDFEMDVRFKPEEGSGLILYDGAGAGQQDRTDQRATDFVALGMRDGRVEFRFDLGSGPGAAVSDLPVTLNAWHHARVRRNRNQAFLSIDDGPEVSATAPGRMVGLALNSQVLVGGVPDYASISPNAGFSNNFVGCLGTITIDNVVHDILKNSSEKAGVDDCDTCAKTNPCQHNGLCQDALTPWGFRCMCPAGFTGNLCDMPGLRCLPGICGIGRCIDQPNGLHYCACPWGTAGKKCAEAVNIRVPSFTKNAYAAYATPKNVLETMDIDITFKPRSANDGIVFYVANDERGHGDFLSLAIRGGALNLRFDLGSGMTNLQSMLQVQLGRWYHVQIMRRGRKATMKINDEEEVTGESQGRLTGLNLATNLYLGGVSDQITIASGVGVRDGFDGCVSTLQINGASYVLNDAGSVLESSSVSDCGDTSACASRPCLNGGRCVENGDDYQCICSNGFGGKQCEASVDICSRLSPCANGGTCVAVAGAEEAFRCHCPLRFTGANCESEYRLERELQFDGEGFLEFEGSRLPHAGAKEADSVALEFKTAEPDGLLLWHSQRGAPAGNAKDFLSLSLKDGFLIFGFELGSGPARIVSRERMNDNQWHRISIKRSEKRGTLSIDNDAVIIQGEARGNMKRLDTTGNLFIGGLTDIPTLTANQHSVGFKGCIRDLEILDSGPIDLSNERGRNGQQCQG